MYQICEYYLRYCRRIHELLVKMVLSQLESVGVPDIRNKKLICLKAKSLFCRELPPETDLLPLEWENISISPTSQGTTIDDRG